MSPTLVVELADDNLCLHNNLAHEIQLMKVSMTCRLIIDCRWNVIMGNEAEKVPKVQKIKERTANETRKG